MSLTSLPPSEFSPAERAALLQLALDSITSGLDTGKPADPGPAPLPEKLSALRACFVTLEQDGELRGCIGTLEAHTGLADDVSHNAYAAAFRDPRFKPLLASELNTLTIQVSVLGEAEGIHFSSEADLVRQLRPGIDGLILQDDGFRGTFLPSVWKSLPDPERFLAHLKLKAGLPADHWSDTLEVWRYCTESFSAQVPEIRAAKRDYLEEALK